MGEGFGGASEEQKVQPLEIPRQCHVDRYWRDSLSLLAGQVFA